MEGEQIISIFVGLIILTLGVSLYIFEENKLDIGNLFIFLIFVLVGIITIYKAIYPDDD